MPYLYVHHPAYSDLSEHAREYLDDLLHIVATGGRLPISGFPLSPDLDDYDFEVIGGTVDDEQFFDEYPDDVVGRAEAILADMFPDQSLPTPHARGAQYDLQEYWLLSPAGKAYLKDVIWSMVDPASWNQSSIDVWEQSAEERRFLRRLGAERLGDTDSVDRPRHDFGWRRIEWTFPAWQLPSLFQRFGIRRPDRRIPTRVYPSDDSTSEGGEMPDTYYTETEPLVRRDALTSSEISNRLSTDGSLMLLDATDQHREGWYQVPTSQNVARTAWVQARLWRGGTYHQGVEVFLADVAAYAALPSGAAALDALVYYAWQNITGVSNREQNLFQIEAELRMPSGFLPRRTSRTANGYIHPQVYEGDRTSHPLGCDCNRCHSNVCVGLHCERCFPEGPVASGCRCEECIPALVDDEAILDDPDPWEKTLLPPVVPGRTRFGIEIEFNEARRDVVVFNCLDRKVAVRAPREYTHELNCYWNMTTDSTVSGGEIVSPVMDGSDHSINEVIEVIRAVKASGGTTGPNVGMHVHLDCTPLDVPTLNDLAANLMHLEPFLQAYVPKHRYDRSTDRSARAMSPSEWDSVLQWIEFLPRNWAAQLARNSRGGGICPVERYVGINWNSLLAFGTVEIRLLGHTLNTVKVRTWLYTLQAIMQGTRAGGVIDRADILSWLQDVGGLDPVYATRYREVVERRKNDALLFLPGHN